MYNSFTQSLSLGEGEGLKDHTPCQSTFIQDSLFFFQMFALGNERQPVGKAIIEF